MGFRKTRAVAIQHTDIKMDGEKVGRDRWCDAVESGEGQLKIF